MLPWASASKSAGCIETAVDPASTCEDNDTFDSGSGDGNDPENDDQVEGSRVQGDAKQTKARRKT